MASTFLFSESGFNSSTIFPFCSTHIQRRHRIQNQRVQQPLIPSNPIRFTPSKTR
jgi:hypothetical protein